MMYKGDPLAGLGKDIGTYTDPVRPWHTSTGGGKDVGTYTDPVRPGMGTVRGRGLGSFGPMPRDFARSPTIGGIGLQRPAYTRRPLRPMVEYYPRDPQR